MRTLVDVKPQGRGQQEEAKITVLSPGGRGHKDQPALFKWLQATVMPFEAKTK